MSPNRPAESFGIVRKARSMAPLTAVFAMLAGMVCSAESRAETLVYLLAGQSNADGRALASELRAELQSPQVEIPFFYRSYPQKDSVYTVLQPGSAGAPTTPGSAYGPEIAFGRKLSQWREKHGEPDRIAILKYARGGSSIAADWFAGGSAERTGDGPAYRTFQDTVAEGLAAMAADPKLGAEPLRIAGVIWVQGESDIDEGPDAYAANLETFIRDVRATYGEGVPFFLSGLSLNQTRYQRPEKPEIVRGFHAVREAQNRVAGSMENVFLLSTDAPDFAVQKDKIHFSAKGQEALGNAFAEAVIKVGCGLRGDRSSASSVVGNSPAGNNLDAL